MYITFGVKAFAGSGKIANAFNFYYNYFIKGISSVNFLTFFYKCETYVVVRIFYKNFLQSCRIQTNSLPILGREFLLLGISGRGNIKQAYLILKVALQICAMLFDILLA